MSDPNPYSAPRTAQKKRSSALQLSLNFLRGIAVLFTLAGVNQLMSMVVNFPIFSFYWNLAVIGLLLTIIISIVVVRAWFFKRS